MTFQLCASCYQEISSCTCNGEPPRAAQTVAEYLTVVEAPTGCARCITCAARKTIDCANCWWCKQESNKDKNQWDDHFVHFGRRHRDDPNPLREDEEPLPPRQPYECPSCGGTEYWVSARAVGWVNLTFRPNTSQYAEWEESDVEDYTDPSTFGCLDCDAEYSEGDPLFDELLERLQI